MQIRRLLSKIIIFVGFPIAILLVIMTITITSTVQQSVTTLNTDALAAQTQAASYQINNYFSKYIGIASQMQLNAAIHHFVQNMTPGTDVAGTEGFADVDQTLRNITTSDSGNIVDTWVADIGTKHIIDQLDGISDFDMTTRPWFKEFNGQNIILTEPYADVFTGKMTVSCIAPLYGADGSTLIGAAGVDIQLDRLYETIKSYKLGETGFYILMSSGGTLIYYPDETLKNHPISESSMSQNIIETMKKKESVNLTFEAIGHTNNGYIAPVGDTGWVVATGLPDQEFNKTYQSVLSSILVILGVTMVVMFILIFLTSGSIVRPLRKLKHAANQIADGNLDVTLENRSKDEIGQVSAAFGRTVYRLQDYIRYINEVSEVLNQIAIGNLCFDLKNEYTGEFSKIKDALGNIKTTLTVIINQFKVSAEQVASGADQVSQASQNLASGAAEQAGALQELSASVTQIADESQRTAQSVNHQKTFVTQSSQDLNTCQTDMQELLIAMNSINNASAQISGIIKIIDDIAFQTNILALNAAVEAARAGSAGKGFSVVAEEVRRLAAKSAQAAQQTSTLIEDSIHAISRGTVLTEAVAASLNDVSVNISGVENMTTEITQTTVEQERATNDIMRELHRVSSVVQSNSQTAEESACASEELSAQAHLLYEHVADFKLETTEHHTSGPHVQSPARHSSPIAKY